MDGLSEPFYGVESLWVKKNKLTSLRTDVCYTEKHTSWYEFPPMWSPPGFILPLPYESAKCAWETLTTSPPREGEKNSTSWCLGHDKMILEKAFFHTLHSNTFRFRNALEFGQRCCVQSSRLGYKHLLKCFAELLLCCEVRSMWATLWEATLLSLGGADSKVWIIQHFH